MPKKTLNLKKLLAPIFYLLLFLTQSPRAFGEVSVTTVLEKIQQTNGRNRYLDWEDVQFFLALKDETSPQQFSKEVAPVISAMEEKLSSGAFKPHFFYPFFIYAIIGGTNENFLNNYLVSEFGAKNYSTLLDFHLSALDFWSGGLGEAPRRLGNFIKIMNPISHKRLFNSLTHLTKNNPVFMRGLMEDSFFIGVIRPKIHDLEKTYKAKIRQLPNSRATSRARNALKALSRLVGTLNELDPLFLEPKPEQTWEQRLTGDIDRNKVNSPKAKAPPHEIPAKQSAFEKYMEIYNIVHFELPFLEMDDQAMAELEAAEKAALLENLGPENPMSQIIIQRLDPEGISACMAELRKAIKNK